VYDENNLKLKNLHRWSLGENLLPPPLRLRLVATAVVGITQNESASPNSFELLLEQPEVAGRVQIRVTEKQNVSEFEFSWTGASPAQREEHEMCFHYGYNRASW